jgi:RNA polymerase sigma-B factor
VYADLAPLFARLADPDIAPVERERVRETLITGYQPVAEHIARRFGNRGQPVEDLRQVAMIGLINAVDRFDPARGREFLAFAVPTITGEVRRYFRDSAWALRVPRRLKELSQTVRATSERLSRQLGHSPRPSDIAAELGSPVEEVYEGLQANLAYDTDALDRSVGGDASLGEIAFGDVDPRLESVADRIALYPALARLAPREALIVSLRFFGDLTQTEIARRVGLSQMHVSRLLAASLRTLRETMTGTASAPATEA